MKLRISTLVSGTAVLAGAIAASVAAPSNAPSNPIRVGIVAVTSDGASDFQGAVEVTITNTSRKTVRIPRWQLPSDLVTAKLFDVSRDGAAVRYQGPMIKRGLPQAVDFAILRPGESYRAMVDLSAAYDLSVSGQYVVAYKAPLQFASTAQGPLRRANGLPMVAQSAPLRLWVDGREHLGKVTAQAKPCNPRKQDCGGGGGGTVGGVTYQGCTTTQVSTLSNAVNAARSYSENAKGYLNSNTVGARYTTWFGAYTSQRYGTASQNFASIDAAMDQNNGQITIDCGCNQSYYAYVYPTRPYEIFVCRAFWSAPLTGTDSKAGTLIHEMSHFNVVAGTDDIVYGQTGARNLAASDPNGALNNADNHEYFAENNPSLN